MKKIFISLLSTTLLLTIIITNTTEIHANNNTSSQAYQQYYSIISDLLSLEQKKTNTLTPKIFNGYDESSDLYQELSSNNQLVYLDLIDFDNDKDSELFYMYTTGNNTYIYEVYSYESNQLKKVLSKEQEFLSSGWHATQSLSLVTVDAITYIKDLNCVKDEFEYNENSILTTINNNQEDSIKLSQLLTTTDEQKIDIVDGVIDELELYTYFQTVDGVKNKISYDEFSGLTSKYISDNEMYLFVNDTGSYYSDLTDNYNSTIETLSYMQDNSSSKYSYNEISSTISSEEYKNIEKFLKIFLLDFVRFYNYDTTNFDKAYLLEFAFDISLPVYETTATKIDSNQNSLQFKSSLPYDSVKKYINDLFGVDIDIKEGETFSIDILNSTHTYTLKDGVIIRDGIDDSNRGSCVYIPDIKKIYDLGNNFYLVNFSEFEGITEELEPTLNKYSAIIRKTNDDNYNMIKIQDNEFQSDAEINTYLNSIVKATKTSTDSGTNYNSSGSLSIFFIISSVLLLSVLTYIFIKSNNKKL